MPPPSDKSPSSSDEMVLPTDWPSSPNELFITIIHINFYFMTKYIKQEMNDLNGTGKTKCYYRLESRGILSTKDLISQIAYPGSGLSTGSVTHVLQSMSDEIARSISKGYSISIEGLGIFKGSIGVIKGKEMDTIDGNDQKRNAASIVIDGVNFRADRELISRANQSCKLKRGKVNRLHISPFTKEERLQQALTYLSNPDTPFMLEADYAKITGLSKFKAHEELVELRNDPDSGITFSGSGNRVIYYINKKANED